MNSCRLLSSSRRIQLQAVWAAAAVVHSMPVWAQSPLAEVRRVVLSSVTYSAPAELVLPTMPRTTAVGDWVRWMQRTFERLERQLMPETAAYSVGRSLAQRMPELPGLQQLGGPGPERAAQPAYDWTERPTEPIVAELLENAQRLGADAVVLAHVHPLKWHTGIETEAGVRITCWVVSQHAPTVRGPFFGVGWARTLKAFKATAKTDAQLVEGAADRAVSMILHQMRTGSSYPLAQPVHAVIVPAEVPVTVLRRIEGTMVGHPIALPSLMRQADVLLQPDVGPFTQLVSDEEQQQRLEQAGLGKLIFWRNAEPESATIRLMAQLCAAEFVFISRIVDLDLSDSVEPDGTTHQRRAACRIRVALANGASGAVLWQADSTGSATSRREVLRGRVRMATEEQVVIDAVRMAYAGARVQFDGFRQGFELQRKPVHNGR